MQIWYWLVASGYGNVAGWLSQPVLYQND